MPNVSIQVESLTGSGAVVDPTIAIRSDSSLLIEAASCLVRESIRIQQNYDENAEDDVKNAQKSTYRAYVIGTLFTSVAFFEAMIREVFLNAVECMPKKARKEKDHTFVGAALKIGSYPNGALSASTVKDMAQLWLQQQTYRDWLKQNGRFERYLPKELRQNPRLPTSLDNRIRRWPTVPKYQLALFLNGNLD
jgi:hypothetical protein